MTRAGLPPKGEAMGHGWLLSLLMAMAAAGMCEAATPHEGKAVPRVVVNILIDQLRSDYLNAFMPLYGDEGFKRMLSEGKRQVGSTIKPFLYYAALNNNMTEASTFKSEVTSFVFGNGENYSPKNYIIILFKI